MCIGLQNQNIGIVFNGFCNVSFIHVLLTACKINVTCDSLNVIIV